MTDISNRPPAHDPYQDQNDYHQHFTETNDYKNLSDSDKQAYASMNDKDQRALEQTAFEREHPLQANFSKKSAENKAHQQDAAAAEEARKNDKNDIESTRGEEPPAAPAAQPAPKPVG